MLKNDKAKFLATAKEWTKKYVYHLDLLLNMLLTYLRSVDMLHETLAYRLWRRRVWWFQLYNRGFPFTAGAILNLCMTSMGLEII